MSLPFPPIALELRDLIVSFADRKTLCALCLVNSDVRQTALCQLYAKLVFRSYAKLEACFLGRSSQEVWPDQEERAWKEGGERKVLERRVRELGFVRDLEIDLSQMNPWSGNPIQNNPLPAIELHQIILDSGAFPIETLRLPFCRPSIYLEPLLHIISPRRLILPSREASLALSFLPLTPDRPLILDCYGHNPPSLINIERTSILSIIWCPNSPVLIHQARITVLLSHAQQLRIVVVSLEQEEETKILLNSMRRNGRLVGRDVGVVYREGLRRDYRPQSEGGGTIWNDELVEADLKHER
jgi:hypothetical protein